MNFIKYLYEWYYKYQRNLAWRNTQNPYKIWISEVILQQTRVNQGSDYYTKFIEKFPDIVTLANAKEEDVLKIWQGLGYYSRARNLHFAAKQIITEYNGIFPTDFNEIIKLKGIGEYSAGAIASLAFKQPFPAIDGNVQRVISRLYGIKIAVNSSTGKHEIKKIILNLIDKKNPDIFNQSLIELGALVCKPKNPECNICPLNQYCFAYKNKNQNDFPVKNKNKKPINRFFYYIIIKLLKEKQTFFYIQKRIKNDIWKNLYDFPSFEAKVKLTEAEIIFKLDNYLIHNNYTINKIKNTVKHQLTHQRIYATFIEIETSKEILEKNNTFLIKDSEFYKFPFPKLIENEIKNSIYI